MLSLNDAPNYSTCFHFWWTQGGTAQFGTQGTTVPWGTAWCIIYLSKIFLRNTYAVWFIKSKMSHWSKKWHARFLCKEFADTSTYRLSPIPMASVATRILQGSSGSLNFAAWLNLAPGHEKRIHEWCLIVNHSYTINIHILWDFINWSRVQC